MQRLIEQVQIVSAIVPIDLQAGANAGDWVSLKLYSRVAVIVFKAAGTAGDDPVLTMEQAQDVSGTGVKALNFTDIWAKVGAQTGIGVFTRVTQAAANTYTDAVSAEAQALWYIDFSADELDVSNGFDCVRLSIPDTGTTAQLGCALYLLYGARYPQAIPSSAIVN